MNRTRLGVVAAAAAVVLLLLPAVSLGQRFRGGGGWDGGWGGRSGFYVGYGSPYGVSFGYGRGYYPYSGYYGYGYSPWWFNSGYVYPSYVYQTPSYSYQSGYPADASYGMTMPDQGNRVLATVRVPSADTKLWIEGQEMNSNGLARPFVSPPLDAGQRYTYTFRAQWDDNGKKVDQTREVRVHRGDRITVNFTAPEKGSGAGTRRESGYGAEEQRLPRGEEAVTPPPPRINPPPARPREETPDRDDSRPKPNAPKSSPEVPK